MQTSHLLHRAQLSLSQYWSTAALSRMSSLYHLGKKDLFPSIKMSWSITHQQGIHLPHPCTRGSLHGGTEISLSLPHPTQWGIRFLCLGSLQRLYQVKVCLSKDWQDHQDASKHYQGLNWVPPGPNHWTDAEMVILLNELGEHSNEIFNKLFWSSTCSDKEWEMLIMVGH